MLLVFRETIHQCSRPKCMIFFGWECILRLQTSPARNGKLDGKGGGNKGIDGWEETVMGSGVSSVRFIWCGTFRS